MYVTCEKQRLVLYSKPYTHLMYLWHWCPKILKSKQSYPVIQKQKLSSTDI